MAEIINLRTARKAQKRAKAESEAAVNRAKFGQSLGGKKARDAETARQAKLLDGAKREPECAPLVAPVFASTSIDAEFASLGSNGQLLSLDDMEAAIASEAKRNASD